MLKKTVTYVDYNGVERTEDFYFNLTKAEIMELELGTSGGLSETINRMTQTLDQPAIMAMFKKIVLLSYGEKSPDGKRFIKSKELSEAFAQTEAYSELVMELLTGGDTVASDFINGVLPKIENQPKVIPMHK